MSVYLKAKHNFYNLAELCYGLLVMITIFVAMNKIQNME